MITVLAAVPVGASPVVVFVGQCTVPGDSIRVSLRNISSGAVTFDSAYTCPPPPAAPPVGAGHTITPLPNPPATNAGWVRIAAGPTTGAQPEVEFIPATVLVPVTPPPPAPGGGTGAVGTPAGAGGTDGLGFGGGPEIEPGEIGRSGLFLAHSTRPTAAGGGLVSLGVYGGFIATHLTTPGESYTGVFASLAAKLQIHGINAAVEAGKLNVYCNSIVVGSNMDIGLGLGMRVGTAPIPEPSTFAFMLAAGLTLLPRPRRRTN